MPVTSDTLVCAPCGEIFHVEEEEITDHPDLGFLCEDCADLHATAPVEQLDLSGGDPDEGPEADPEGDSGEGPVSGDDYTGNDEPDMDDKPGAETKPKPRRAKKAQG